MKKCTKCGLEKEETEFTKRGKDKNRLRSWCKECYNEGTRKRYLVVKKENPEKLKVEAHEKYLRRREKDLTGFREKNKLSKRKQYYKKRQNDPEALREMSRYYGKRKSPQNKIACNLRTRLCGFLMGNKKSVHMIEIVGCSFKELRLHLEKQFLPGMTWENYGRGKGKWNMDHIIPCASFNLLLEEEQRKCFHYTNLQPLWSGDNVRKSSTFMGRRWQKIA
jgi:hypothetical protein